MIQRVQSIWLLLAAVVMAGVFYFPIYKYSDGLPLTIGDNYIAIVLVAISIILSFVAVFSFRSRKSQKKFVWLNILCCILVLAWLYYSEMATPVDHLGGYFWIGAFLPLICIILLFLALQGIRKDEKLIKSMDRLR